MFTAEEATKERVDAYLAALENEQGQLAQALAQEKAAGNSDRVKRLEQRGKANADEIARVKKLAGKVPATAEPEEVEES